jgi:hypothetical protein
MLVNYAAIASSNMYYGVDNILAMCSNPNNASDSTISIWKWTIDAKWVLQTSDPLFVSNISLIIPTTAANNYYYALLSHYQPFDAYNSNDYIFQVTGSTYKRISPNVRF